MPPFLYIFLGALAVISALGVVVQRNPIHSLLSLIGTLLVIAILFIGEDAVVVGFLQIIVYAGAIMVLFLFVIWLLNLQVESGPTGHLALKFFGSFAAATTPTDIFPPIKAPVIGVGPTSKSADLFTRTRRRRGLRSTLPPDQAGRVETGDLARTDRGR